MAPKTRNGPPMAEMTKRPAVLFSFAALEVRAAVESRGGRKGGIAIGGLAKQLLQLVFLAPPGAGSAHASRKVPGGGADTSSMQQISPDARIGPRDPMSCVFLPTRPREAPTASQGSVSRPGPFS